MSATVHAWLRARTPAPPAALLHRVECALLEADGPSDLETAQRCIAAAIAMLTPLLEREHAGREAALDLLAADALVTYAFEAASEHPEILDDRASAAMRAIAALATPASPGASAPHSHACE